MVKTLSLEKALAQLEGLVSKLENQDIELEESLKAFEQGITITRNAQAILRDAEQKVALLIEQDNEPKLEPLNKKEIE